MISYGYHHGAALCARGRLACVDIDTVTATPSCVTSHPKSQQHRTVNIYQLTQRLQVKNGSVLARLTDKVQSGCLLVLLSSEGLTGTGKPALGGLTHMA